MEETNETSEPQPKVVHPKKPCKFCGQMQLAQNMSRHIRARHQDDFEYEVVDRDDEGTTIVVCPDCGKHCKSTYIDYHRKRIHGPRGKAKGLVGQVMCATCGKFFARNYLGEHMRREHGIYGGLSGTIRADLQTLPKREAELVPINTPNPTPEPLTFEMVPIIVLQDNKGGIWHAERVR